MVLLLPSSKSITENYVHYRYAFLSDRQDDLVINIITFFGFENFEIETF